MAFGTPSYFPAAGGAGGGIAVADSASAATSGTVTFSNSNGVSFGLNGQTMTASVLAGAGVGGIAGSNASTVTNGTVQWGNANGITFGLNGSTITGSKNGVVGFADSAGTQTSGTVQFSNSNGVSFGLNAGTVTASVAAAAPTLSVFMPDGMGSVGAGFALSVFHKAPLFFPVAGGPFPGNMTISTLNFGMSGNTAVSSYTAHSWTCSVGLYTLKNSTQLSLLNSASVSFGAAASTSDGFQTNYAGLRRLSIHSSKWSAQPVLSNTHYWMGVMFETAGSTVAVSIQCNSIGIGGVANNASGYIGVTPGATGTIGGGFPFHGHYSATTGAFPAAISRGEIGFNMTGGNPASILPAERLAFDFLGGIADS